MAHVTEDISKLTDTERQVVQEQLAIITIGLKQTQRRMQEYKAGNTSALKLFNDLRFARGLLDEALEKLTTPEAGLWRDQRRSV
jgi:hypothetical protein